MPSPVVTLDLITSAMRLTGIISSGVGETLTADEATDALSTLNDLLESMSTQNLFVWGQENEVFATVAGQATRTIGPTGNYVTARPVRINGGYTTFNGVDFPFQMIGPDQYDSIQLKTMQQQIPEVALYVNDFPNGLLTLWPTPMEVVPITLNIDRVLASAPTAATVLSMPTGYLNYMRHELAIMLAPEYGVQISDVVRLGAVEAKAQLKRANKVRRRAVFDVALQDTTYGWANWRTGD